SSPRTKTSRAPKRVSFGGRASSGIASASTSRSSSWIPRRRWSRFRRRSPGFFDRGSERSAISCARESRSPSSSPCSRTVARALRVVPEVNSRFHADDLEIFDDVNVGIVISLDEHGLVVPVLHSVQDADLFTIASRLQSVTERARQRALRSQDLAGGTFTI